jgi:hypothetical protein
MLSLAKDSKDAVTEYRRAKRLRVTATIMEFRAAPDNASQDVSPEYASWYPADKARLGPICIAQMPNIMTFQNGTPRDADALEVMSATPSAPSRRQ